MGGESTQPLISKDIRKTYEMSLSDSAFQDMRWTEKANVLAICKGICWISMVE